MRGLLIRRAGLTITLAAALFIAASPASATPSRNNNNPSSGATIVGGGGGTITVTFTRPGSATAGPGISIGSGGLPSLPGSLAPINPWTPANIAACNAQTGGTAIIACPAAAAAPPPPPEPGAAIVAGATTTLQRELPHPQLQVQPGYAVTGLKAYLQITTPTGLHFTFAGYRNAVFMTCSWNHFDVNWGDGTDDPDVTSLGGPWPNGDVTHVYQDASPSDDLHVTEYWACPWTDELGAAGVLDLQTANDLPLEIREIQTVEN
jgi:hypothetical protein